MQLAFAEMYLIVAAMWRRYGTFEERGEEGEWMGLFETTYARDVEMVRDAFVPYPRKETRGIRVVVGKKDGGLGRGRAG